MSPIRSSPLPATGSRRAVRQVWVYLVVHSQGCQPELLLAGPGCHSAARRGTSHRCGRVPHVCPATS